MVKPATSHGRYIHILRTISANKRKLQNYEASQKEEFFEVRNHEGMLNSDA